MKPVASSSWSSIQLAPASCHWLHLQRRARARAIFISSLLRPASHNKLTRLACMQDLLETVEGEDARVIQCLQDYREELTSSTCKQQVHKLTQRASQDIRMDEPLADACYEDRARLCQGVQPVRVLFPDSYSAVSACQPCPLRPHVCLGICYEDRVCLCQGAQLERARASAGASSLDLPLDFRIKKSLACTSSLLPHPCLST